MRKRVLMSAMILMVLFVIMMAPVNAKKTVELYASHVEMEQIDAGEVWEANGILHMKGSYWRGTEEVIVPASLGTATFEEWYNHLSLNSATGEGTVSAKWKLTFPQGTIEGNWRGKITQGYIINGTFVGTHGTGEFEGVKKKGTVDGMLTSETTAVAEISGIIVWP
jgi:hypothetical protein